MPQESQLTVPAVAVVTAAVGGSALRQALDAVAAAAGVTLAWFNADRDYRARVRGALNLVTWGVKWPHRAYTAHGRRNVLFLENGLLCQRRGAYVDATGYFADSAIVRRKEYDVEPTAAERQALAAHLQAAFGWSAESRANPAGPILVALQTHNDAPVKYYFPLRPAGADPILVTLELCARYLPKGRKVLVRPHPKDARWWQANEAAYRQAMPPEWQVATGGNVYELLTQCAALVTVNSTLATEALGLAMPVAVLGRSAFTDSGAALDCSERPELLGTLLDWAPDQVRIERYLCAVLRHQLPYAADAATVAANPYVQEFLQRALAASGKPKKATRAASRPALPAPAPTSATPVDRPALLARYAACGSSIAAHLPLLHDTVVDLKAQTVVELGTRHGDSTVALAIGVERTGGHLYSCDIRACRHAHRRLGRYGLAGRWTFTQADDMEYVKGWTRPIDVLFLDSSHKFVHTLAELRAWTPHVRPGGVILMHDTVSCPGVAPAIRQFAAGEPAGRWTYTERFESCGLGILRRTGGKPEPTLARPAAPASRVAPAWPDKVALLSCAYGQGNRLVVDAHRRALCYWGAQEQPFTLYYAELIFPGETSAYADLLQGYKDCRHIAINGADRHRVLMQKEALLNLAAARAIADGCGILVLLDADSWTPDRQWLKKVAAKLSPAAPANRNVALQPWRQFHDTHPAIDRLAGRSYSFAYMRINADPAADRGGSPGLCWAFTAPYWCDVGGLNPWGLSGSGDNLLVWELVSPEHRLGARCNFRYFDEIVRPVPRCSRLDHVATDFVHEYHGLYAGRAYGFSRQVIDLFLPLRDLVGMDESGLLYWQQASALRTILADKPAIATPEGYRAVLARHGLAPDKCPFCLGSARIQTPLWAEWAAVLRQWLTQHPMPVDQEHGHEQAFWLSERETLEREWWQARKFNLENRPAELQPCPRCAREQAR